MKTTTKILIGIAISVLVVFALFQTQDDDYYYTEDEGEFGSETEGLQQPLENAVVASLLLDQAPTGPERSNQLSESVFLERAASVGDIIEPTDVESAIEILEALASDMGPVTAVIESEPDGVDVRYHRLYRTRSSTDPVVTADAEITLDIPASYYFWAVSPARSDSIVEKRVECFRPCRVQFVF